MKHAANLILRHQGADGSITMAPLPVATTKVIPYFGNHAAQGLAAAYRVTGDTRYRDAARRWVAWYEAHQENNGTIYDYTGAPGAWKSTGDFDSTDSYASTYLELVRDLHQAGPNAAWLKARIPFVNRAIEGIRLTLQPNGLTLAKPTWPVMYTMDNVEVALGLRAAVQIARAVKDESLARSAQGLAERTEAGIARDLWDVKNQVYYVGVQPDGGRMDGFSKWYPDVMANLMAVGWGPSSARHRPLYKKLVVAHGAGIPRTVKSMDDLGVLAWWGFAAHTIGDDGMFTRIQTALADFEKSVQTFDNPATAGHMVRLLAVDSSRAK